MDLSLETFPRLPVWQASLIGLGGILLCLAGYRFVAKFSRPFAAGGFGLRIFGGTVGYVLGRADRWFNTTATGMLGGTGFGIWAGQLLAWSRRVGLAAIGAGVGGVLALLGQRHGLIDATSILRGVAADAGAMLCLNFAGMLPVQRQARVDVILMADSTFAEMSAQLQGSEEIASQFRRLREARRGRKDPV